MEIAIVGANSFLSQALLRELRSEHNLIQVYNDKRNRLNKFERSLHIDDFLNEKPKVDCIYYIASYINFDESSSDIDTIYKTNVLLLKRISELFTSAKIIHTSSVSVYKVTGKEINEFSELHPNSSYGMSKLWAEQIVNHHKGDGINIRISSLFGEGMNISTFLPLIINSAIQKKEIKIYGKGERKQNYVYVNDVVNILCKALYLKKRTTLLAVGNKSFSNTEIAHFIKEYIKGININFIKEDKSPSFFYNNKQTNELLGIESKPNAFKEQIKNTILWMQKQY